MVLRVYRRWRRAGVVVVVERKTPLEVCLSMLCVCLGMGYLYVCIGTKKRGYRDSNCEWEGSAGYILILYTYKLPRNGLKLYWRLSLVVELKSPVPPPGLRSMDGYRLHTDRGRDHSDRVRERGDDMSPPNCTKLHQTTQNPPRTSPQSFNLYLFKYLRPIRSGCKDGGREVM